MNSGLPAQKLVEAKLFFHCFNTDEFFFKTITAGLRKLFWTNFIVNLSNDKIIGQLTTTIVYKTNAINKIQNIIYDIRIQHNFHCIDVV